MYLSEAIMARITPPDLKKNETPATVKVTGVSNGRARQCPTFTGNTTNYHRR